jgi:hypothetical protein
VISGGIEENAVLTPAAGADREVTVSRPHGETRRAESAREDLDAIALLAAQRSEAREPARGSAPDGSRTDRPR